MLNPNKEGRLRDHGKDSDKFKLLYIYLYPLFIIFWKLLGSKLIVTDN
jgi:hypothetical protein